MARPQFLYSPLKKDEIRLFRISPAANNDPQIEINLSVTRRENCLDYRLLTYTWDGASHTEIVCNDYALRVTSSLYPALLALRNCEDYSSFIFVDEVCVNMANNDERSRVNRQMSSILRQAFQTTLWVGEDHTDTSAAFKLISILSSARRETFQDMPLDHTGPQTVQTAIKRYRELLHLPPPMAWKALDDLMARSIFTRSLITEDIVFSRDLLLRCGPFETSWSNLCYGLEAYVFSGLPIRMYSSGTKVILDWNNLRKHRLSGRSVTPSRVLETLRDLTAADSRDRVFAALSTINATTPRATSGRIEQGEPTQDLGPVSLFEWIRRDYQKEFHDICFDIAMALNSSNITETSFCSLSMVEDLASQRRIVSGTLQTDNIPLSSWVPDWTFSRRIYRLNCTESRFMACKGRPKYSVSLEKLKNTLRFAGCVVDAIDEVASYLPPRRWYDKYNTSGANSIIFLEWMERSQKGAVARYQGRDDRLLLDWVETIQAKGCDLLNEFWELDSASLTTVAKSWLTLFEDEDQVVTEEIRHFHAACLPSYGRRFGITRRGNFCLIPRFTERNDLVCIPNGSRVPFVFRKVEDMYLNIGECYIHDAMNGEALSWEDIQEVEFVLR